jgi:hypothetical protein
MGQSENDVNRRPHGHDAVSAVSNIAYETTFHRAWVSYLADTALLTGLCLLFFWRDLTPVVADRWSFAAGDFTQQFYAFARYEAARLQSGQLPLWNPYIYAGHPFLADIQSAVFYPLSLWTMLVTAVKGFTYRALEMEASGIPLPPCFYLLAPD